MPMTPEKRAAHMQLEDAVVALVEAYESFTEGQVIMGFTLVVNGVRYSSPEHDEDFTDGDEESTVSSYTHFVRIGQQPGLTRGMLETTIDRYRYQ